MQDIICGSVGYGDHIVIGCGIDGFPARYVIQDIFCDVFFFFQFSADIGDDLVFFFEGMIFFKEFGFAVAA